MALAIIGFCFAASVVVAFIFGLRSGLIALILVRPLCDRIFELARFDVMGHAESYGALINIGVICAMVAYMHLIWRRVPFKLLAAWLPFLTICLLAVVYSPVPVDGFRKFLTYVTFFAMFGLSFVIAISQRDVVFFLKMMIASSFLPVLYGLFQAITGIDWYSDSRIHSTFTHPNIFAFYIISTIGTILFLLSTDSVRISAQLRLFLHGYLIPLMLALLMTKTRSAWIASAMLFFIYGVVYDRRALIGILVIPLLFLVVPALRDRITQLGEATYYIGGGSANLNSFAWRELLWERTMPYIWQSPIFGHGLDSFRFYSPLFFELVPKGANAHNVYVQFAFETGLIGLIGFFLIFWRSYVWLFRSWQFDRRGITMAIGIMGAYLVAGFSDNLWEYVSFEWCFWFSFGLIFAHVRQFRLAAAEERLRQSGAVGVRATRSGVAK